MTPFPKRKLASTTQLFRIHRASNDPSYFGNGGAMRFDPPPSHVSQFGTCYVARTEIACFLEVFGGLPVVSQNEIDLRRTSTFSVARQLQLANLTAQIVLGRYRIDGSMQTGMVRAATQHLAAERFDDGFDGLVYRIRHDPRLVLEGIALFYTPGDHPEYFLSPKTRPISVDVMRLATETFGIDILPRAELP